MSSKEETSPPEWTVLYHSPGKFKGRGEFLRLMLEDAGITNYANVGDGLYGADGMMDMFRGTPEAIDADKTKSSSASSYHPPVLYPPAIWHRPTEGEQVLVNQVSACMIYLGEQLGYAPSSSTERARANSILHNAMDYISDGRKSFHPVKNAMSYNDQKQEGDKASKEFTQTRMRLYLHHFNKTVARLNDGPKKPVAGGQNVTYADLALFHSLDATASQFNSDFYEHAWDNEDVPELKEYYAWMKARPNLQAYFKSDRCAPFAGDSMM